MKKAKIHLLIRKWHRYLGVFLGIQFLMWTIGGLYFSWTKIDEVRGDNLRKENPPLVLTSDLAGIGQIVEELQKNKKVVAFLEARLVDIVGKPHYQIIYQAGKQKKVQLADAQTGKLRPALTKQEAIEVAKSRLKQTADITEVAYLTKTNGHHEYREKPLPAYAITFGGKVNTTVYVSAEMGTVQVLRNNAWRIFDFLWMLHTMDYSERDNINNWALRIFSLIGLVTICSGFALFFVSLRIPKKS
jgi:hypothetical protein